MVFIPLFTTGLSGDQQDFFPSAVRPKIRDEKPFLGPNLFFLTKPPPKFENEMLRLKRDLYIARQQAIFKCWFFSCNMKD